MKKAFYYQKKGIFLKKSKKTSKKIGFVKKEVKTNSTHCGGKKRAKKHVDKKSTTIIQHL